jgi:hypothetical protein
MNRSKSIKTIICAAALAIAMLASVPSFAVSHLTQIWNPDATYTSTTSLLAITGNTNTRVNSIADGNLTASFSNAQRIGAWGWASPPYTESASPRTLYNNTSSLTITFDKALTTFGLETESNMASVYSFDMEFYNGDTSIGSINRVDISGNAGARLLAASSDVTFNKVVLTTTAPTGFGTAQLRYKADSPAAVPEASTLVGFGSALAMAGPGMIGWLRRRRA